ncbi:MAG: hypothetical protein LQ337_004155 [Flavoplaca oasis]|nr:MAG: hypothetical protein LQ337_004155 [Flavoplaca oasis]
MAEDRSVFEINLLDARTYKLDELPALTMPFSLHQHIFSSCKVFHASPQHLHPSSYSQFQVQFAPQYFQQSHLPASAMTDYGNHFFTPTQLDIFALAVMDDKYSDSTIASILQLEDWKAFRTITEDDIRQAKANFLEDYPNPRTTYQRSGSTPYNQIQETLRARSEYIKNAKFEDLLRKFTQKALDFLMYGYTRTNLLPGDIAKAINKEALNLPNGPLNPIDAVMVEKIYDYYAQRGDLKHYIENWKGKDANDAKLKETEDTYKKHLGRPASHSITVPPNPRGPNTPSQA